MTITPDRPPAFPVEKPNILFLILMQLLNLTKSLEKAGKYYYS